MDAERSKKARAAAIAASAAKCPGKLRYSRKQWPVRQHDDFPGSFKIIEKNQAQSRETLELCRPHE
ncbi:hypothetical protein [Ruegeria profundi]|uniref:hypothetical protein n=1 Tax=Ruegeria profundi TaxID=1685378 RepID=UPI0012FE47AB|nr:hypothetical protein [Ruegeria profundi]